MFGLSVVKKSLSGASSSGLSQILSKNVCTSASKIAPIKGSVLNLKFDRKSNINTQFESIRLSSTSAAKAAPASNVQSESNATNVDSKVVDKLIELSRKNVEKGNKPFSCIIVNDTTNEVISEGVDNSQNGNPTDTAVMNALDRAARKLGGFKDLKSCTVYLMSYPDPMSLACLYHSTPKRVVFLTKTEEYSKHFLESNKYFNSMEDLYNQVGMMFKDRKMPMNCERNIKGVEPFKLWHDMKKNGGKTTPEMLVSDPSTDPSNPYIKRAIELARENVKNGGNPFSCVVVKNHPNGEKEVIAEAVNTIHETGNPTDHSEIIAIRKAIEKLGPTKDLSDCDFYMLPHPCPMCLTGMYMVSPGKVIFSLQRDDFAPYFGNTGRLYSSAAEFTAQFAKPWDQQLLKFEYLGARTQDALKVFQQWEKNNGSSSKVPLRGFNDDELPYWGNPNHLRKILNFPTSQILETASYKGDLEKQFLLSTRTLNITSRNHYKEWNSRVGNNIFPLIVALDLEPEYEGVGSSFKLYLRDGTVKIVRPTPPMYEIHKNVSHLALGLATITSPYFLYPKVIFTKPSLLDMQNKIEQSLLLLSDIKKEGRMNDLEKEYELAEKILNMTLSYTKKFIHENSASLHDLRKYGKEILPLLKESGVVAAKIQMKAIINALNVWKKELGPEEWSKLHAVIPTVWPVSSDNPRETALRHVMDPNTVDTNLIIAEGCKDETEARVTLARTKDKAIAHLIFGTGDVEARSMVCAYSSPRDLLADAVEVAIHDLTETNQIPQSCDVTKNSSRSAANSHAKNSSQCSHAGHNHDHSHNHNIPSKDGKKN